MLNATKFLTAAEQREVESAVKHAEEQTAAEIVTVVATESGRYDRSEAIIGVLGSLLGIIALHLINSSSESNSWTANAQISLAWQAVVIVAGFIAGNLLASYIHPLRRLFVPEREVNGEVSRAAKAIFTDQRLYSTRDSGGLLLYVSLFERRIVVLADEGLLTVMGQEFPAQLRDTAVNHLRKGQRLATFIETIKQAASGLADHMPRRADDVDELPNHLVCIHPRI